MIAHILNASEQSVTASSLVNLGYSCRKDIKATGTSISIPVGRWKILVAVNAVATATGEMSFTLQSNGTEIPGATGFATAAAIGDEFTIIIPAVVSFNKCCEGSFDLSVLSAAACTVGSVSTIIERAC